MKAERYKPEIFDTRERFVAFKARNPLLLVDGGDVCDHTLLLSKFFIAYRTTKGIEEEEKEEEGGG